MRKASPAAGSYGSADAANAALLIQDQIENIALNIFIWAVELPITVSLYGSIEAFYLAFKLGYLLAWLFLKFGDAVLGKERSSVGLPTPTLANPFMPGPWLWWIC